MPERLAPLRLALAQINPTRRRSRGQRGQDPRTTSSGHATPGAELVLFPELALSGYPPEDLLLKEHFLRANAEALTELAAGVEGIVAIVGFPERTEDVFNSIAVIADGAVRTTLPQDAAVELRRGRRGALFPGRSRRRGDRPRRRADRPHGVRGHVGAGRARVRGGRGRRGADRQLVRLAVPEEQGPAARADAPAARARQPRRGRVLQHGRRPGRARLRRPLGGDRPRGLRARARASVRRGAGRRDRRRAGRADRPAARHAAAPAGAEGAAADPPRRAASSAPSTRRWSASRATSRPCSSPRPRCTPRSAPACTTTSRRTASSTS